MSKEKFAIELTHLGHIRHYYELKETVSKKDFAASYNWK